MLNSNSAKAVEKVLNSNTPTKMVQCWRCGKNYQIELKAASEIAAPKPNPAPVQYFCSYECYCEG